MTQDQKDFVEMLKGASPHLAKWGTELAKAGMDPRDIAYRLEYEVSVARGWCNGRYG